MASLLDMRRRIKSVKNTQQITKAMKMVAAAKLKRAQDRVVASRPFAGKMSEVLGDLSAKVAGEVSHPLLDERGDEKYLIVLVSADKGLAGAFNANIIKATQAFLKENQDKASEMIPVGRKGRDFVIRSQLPMLAEFTNYGDRPGLNDASAIAQVAVDAFLNGDVDIVYLVYSKFVNTVTQTPTAVQLLPVQPPAGQNDEQKTVEYIYEPDARTIFEALLPRYVDVLVYQALLENIASFYSAQMVAMKNATDNANDLVQDLTLAYNKARQASITTQILEVVSGANALG